MSTLWWKTPRREPATLGTSSPSSAVKKRTPEDLTPVFLNAKKKEDELSKIKSSKAREFYEKQNELIDVLLNPTAVADEEEEAKADAKVRFAVRASMVANILLFCMQLVSASLSGSLALISTCVDAAMDVLSNGILLATDYMMNKHNPYKYPAGKTRMEPSGIILFACFMAFMAITILREAVTVLIDQQNPNVTLGIVPIVMVAAAIGIKSLLWIYCRVLSSPTGQVLAQDHRNDITLNSFGLATAILGKYFFWWIDPAGSCIISLLILKSWCITAYEELSSLLGQSAPPEVISKFIYIAMLHSPEIVQIDTCRAFNLGPNLYVELDIVLPETTPLNVAHDIGESLQQTLESLPEVERAFVHIDYTSNHNPLDEHKYP